MRLWLLRPRELPKGDNPWEPWYDKCFGFVVRAETEATARRIAQENACDEKSDSFLGIKTADTTTPWEDSKYSTCEELTADGDEGIVIEDVHSA